MHGVDWLAAKASDAGPELLGGFAGYMFHELRHALFKRPGRALMRWLGRRKRMRHTSAT